MRARMSYIRYHKHTAHMYQPKHLKVFLTGLIAVTSSQLVYADIIVLTDGTTLNAHNVDVAAKWVYYT